jgi:hypothetical protein
MGRGKEMAFYIEQTINVKIRRQERVSLIQRIGRRPI